MRWAALLAVAACSPVPMPAAKIGKAIVCVNQNGRLGDFIPHAGELGYPQSCHDVTASCDGKFCTLSSAEPFSE